MDFQKTKQCFPKEQNNHVNQKIPFYQIIGKEEEIFLKAAEERLPVLLKGPTGSGKSRFLEYIAHKMNRRLITVLCNEETSATDT